MTLKHYILPLILMSISTICFAQTSYDIGKITLGVRFFDAQSKETETLSAFLENKLIGLASLSGFSTFGNNHFFICPNITINNVEAAEGGMKNIYIAYGELQLIIQDDIDGTIYSSSHFSFRGLGTSKEIAIKNGVSSIQYNGIEDFFKTGKKKILDYFISKKEYIFTQANHYAAKGEYDKAITLLMTLPEELTDLYAEALQKANAIYSQKIKTLKEENAQRICDNNNTILTKANTLLAMHKPNEALKGLWEYKSGNPMQDNEYKEIVEKAERQISSSELDKLKKEKQQWEEHIKESQHRREMQERQLNLEIERIKILKGIACQYIQREKETISNNKKTQER